ncbi:MAG: M64 family metallopeptidase [Myxococcota bacterium]|nr:M64 family metallopeptidase [Myxococcota bacterium]
MTGPPAFAQRCTGRTLRVDTRHGGRRGAEWIEPEALSLEGEWSGGRTLWDAPRDVGDYRCVLESDAGEHLFTAGYGSFFGEWVTTREAETRERVFSESVRLPEPRGRALLRFERRGRGGAFAALCEQRLEPGTATPAGPAPEATVRELLRSGPAAAKVNLLFVAEGYDESERERFFGDASGLCEILFGTEPYRSRHSDFNVRALYAPSAESGITDPGSAVERDTLLAASFDTFGIDRYMLTLRNAELRRLCSGTPYDTLVVVCNTAKYGGGGVYDQYTCLAAHTEHTRYLLLHEFGHSFAGLADEYYAAPVTYEFFEDEAGEPWQANVTADPTRPKWREWIEPDTPLPSPWEQPAFDALMARRERAVSAGGSEATARRLLDEAAELLRAQPHAGRVGAFEGACYRARGLFRPEVDCMMFTRTCERFCRVCTQAIHRRIDELTG